MLESLLPKPRLNRLAVRVADPALEEFLTLLLQQWRFTVTLDPDDETTLLAEEGIVSPEPMQLVIWLHRSSYASQGRLQIPMSIEDLYALLERRFHRPPRRHLRVSLALPCRVEQGGQGWESTISSLSDQGCRVSLPKELVRGEHLKVVFQAGALEQQHDSRVIYCIQRPPSTAEPQFDIGVLFLQQPAAIREALRDFIISSYLCRIKPQMAPERFAASLASLDLPPGVRAHLETC